MYSTVITAFQMLFDVFAFRNGSLLFWIRLIIYCSILCSFGAQSMCFLWK